MNKITNPMVLNRQKKKALALRTFIVAVFMALFTQVAQAQTRIFMRDGSTTITRDNPTYLFYDSHGPSQTPECWNYWYAHNEDFTYIFKPENAGDMITVSFNLQACYNNDNSIGDWALRLNNDFLYVYNGNGVNEDNLIAAYTGNSKQTFSIMTDGPVTFHFVSDGRYREEGWYATVQLVQGNQGQMTAQAPFIRRSTCYDAAELLPTTFGAEIWYTTDGSNPTTSSTAELYKTPIDFNASGNTVIKAASKLNSESTSWSAVVDHTFTDADRIPIPGKPTITRTANTNEIVMTPAAVPTGVNETYVVRYTVTTDGTEPAEPDINNSTLYTAPIICTRPNTWYKAKTFGVSCSNWVSTEMDELKVTKLYAPAPVISFGDDMTIVAAEGGVTYNILYTLDGTEPNLSSTPMNGTTSATTVSLAGIPYGTTVKALSYKTNGTAVDTQYEPSAVVTKIYMPTDENGNTQNYVDGTLVLIDDREDHTWSYYSDSITNPIYSMKPADIKITYYGNGTNNMTPNPTNNNLSNAVANPNNLSYFTENATNVHVNHDASANQFIYLKTLENNDPKGKTNNYTYTTIPNPFQVRPIHQPSKGASEAGLVNNVVNAIEQNAPETGEVTRLIPGYNTVSDVYPRAIPDMTTDEEDSHTREITSRDVTYEKVTASQTDWSGTYLLAGISGTTCYAFDGVIGGSSTYGYSWGRFVPVALDGNTISDINSTSSTNTGTAALLTVAPVTYSGNTYYTIQINSGNYLGSNSSGFVTSTSANSTTYYWNISYDSSNSAVILYSQATSNSYRIRRFSEYDGSSNYTGFSNNENLTYSGSTFTYYGVSLFKQTSSGGSNNSDCDTEDFSGYTASNYSSSTYDRPSDWYYATSSNYAPRVSSNSALSSNYNISGMSGQGNFLYMVGSGNYAVMPRTENLTSVSFKYAYESSSSGTLQVGYVTNTSNISGTFTQFTDVTTSGNSGNLTTVNLTAADINTLNNNSDAHLAFYWNYSSNYGVGIDDIVICASLTPTISVAPSTASVVVNKTVQLTATTANAPGATVTWTSSNTSIATVSFNSKATSTATVTGVAAGSAEITASITVSNTTYTSSSIVTVVPPSYCSPAPTSIDGTGMHPVVFGSGDEIVNNTTYPTSSPYYGDYSSMNGAYQQGATAEVQMSFYTHTGNNGYNYGVVIWVDWNQDYEFEDSEIVYTGTSTTPSSTSSPGTLTASFMVPASQAIGYYRMRIGAADSYFDSYISSGGTNAHDPCYTGTYATFHDYTLHVIAAVEPPAEPVIAVASGTYTAAFNTAITCATSGAVIYYTTDGSTPSASNGIQINSGDVVSITETCTLKAVAVKDGAVSTVASANYYISSTGGGSLDCEDFESYVSEANTSYNTEGTLPSGWSVYYGGDYYFAQYAPHLYNGTYARDGVGIIMTAGTDATYGSSYYLKTDIALVEGATVTFNTWVESASYGTMTYGYMVDATFYSLGVATTAYYSGATASDGITTFTVSSAAAGQVLAFKWAQSSSYWSAVIDNICQESTGAPSAPVFDLAAGEYTGTQQVHITCSTSGATIYYTTDGSTPSATNGTPIASGGVVNIGTGTTTLQALAVNEYGVSSVTSATYVISTGASNNADYRGFYAWKLKSLSDGLTITVDGTPYTSSNLGNGVIVYAEQDVVFSTDNAEGNEVEFEALWAQAYVTTCTANNGLSNALASNTLNANVTYERNFVVVTNGTQTNAFSNTNQKPVTITQLYPDGTGTMSSASRYLAGGFTANKNTKFENIYMQNTDTPYTVYHYTYYRCYRTGNNNYTYYYYHENTDTWTTSQNDATVYSGTWETNFTNTLVTLTGDTYNGYQVYMYVITKTPETTYTYTTYNGNGHDLVFGRGILPTTTEGACVGLVKGIGSSSTANLNYTIRIESGVYHHVTYIDGYNDKTGYSVQASLTFSGANNRIKGVLGCDYDRALESNNSNYDYTNAPLRITYNMIVAATPTLSNQGETEFFTSTIKSGYFGSGFADVGEGDAYQSFYLGVANTYNTGKRTLTIEGGKLNLSLAGGIDTGNTSNDALTIRMKGGTVAGAVYGAAAFAASAGGRKFVFTGGTVNGWIAGGCNGTKTTGGKLDGSTFVYFGGNAKCDSNGSTVTIGAGEATGGNIFGAGSGNKDATETATVGEVDNSTIVIADNAIVERNVYGGGNYGYVCAGTNHKSNIYVLGGKVNGSVFGGANLQKGQIVNITMNNGEVVNNIYGGSNNSGTVNGLATISVAGGKVKNVFGGGYGKQTTMSSGTKVSVSGGTVSENLYGGGALGYVNGNVEVAFSGGTVTDVFGAGKGSSDSDANINGNTKVTVSGGTVNGSVYGGGEQGSVRATTTKQITPDALSSTVTISGGEVKGDVFGGGKMGYTDGATFVNVTGDIDKTIIRQNVFGGAYGVHDQVFVGGQKTVNIMGGRVYGSVYGGSRNADDANVRTGYSTTETATTCVTNITGGQIEQHVYAAGYYGKTYGSVYGFIGLNAVQEAPHHADSLGSATAGELGFSNVEYMKNKLVVKGTVWAGGDWGVFNPDAAAFGDPTVSGNSNLYIDGLGYSTDGNDPNANNYFIIEGSIFGSGTSCDAGKKERTLILRDYGVDVANTGSDADVNPFVRASRHSASIQRFHNVLFDRTHIGLTGQGKINSLNNTEKYALYEIDTVARMANGSSLVMNAPSSQLKSFRSVTCDDSYTISLKDDSNAFAAVNYDKLGDTPGGDTDNKVRVNGGSYIEVRYFANPDSPASGEKSYGQLEGFFHMMSSNDSDDATCAYARPKQSTETGNGVPNDVVNSGDGGFVSYASRYNQYDADGGLASETGVQLRYENHTPNQRENSEYFRIWRYGGNKHYIEGVLNAEATNEGPDYKTVSVTVQLPAWTGKDSYYRFDRKGTTTLNTLIDYGSDVLTYNAAAYGAVNGGNWMYYDTEVDFEAEENNDPQVTGLTLENTTLQSNLAHGIEDNRNLNYGLVIVPGDAMTGSTYIINDDADEYLATKARFDCATGGMTQVPTVTFTLTYSNHLSANMTWDPILIPLVQVDKDGKVTDYVTVALTINTSTELTSGFTTQVYARMNGSGNASEMATVHVVLPTFHVADNGEESQFTLVNAVFTPDEQLAWDESHDAYVVVDDSHNVAYDPKTGTSFGPNNFALTISAVANPDNTDDWRFATGEQDGAPGNGSDLNEDIGQAGGRSSLTFGFTLYYNGNIQVGEKTHMGDVVFTIGLTNYQGGTGENHFQTFTIKVEVYRIGKGKNFYVDGHNGEDASGENRGKYPDLAAKTINYIFNRLDYMPGDNIFVVNEMPITKGTTWDGAAFQNDVNVYRYPGGHSTTGENPDFDNSAYLGTLATVTRELTIKSIKMDGMYEESQATQHYSTIYPGSCTFDGEASAPMITIEDGARVNLTANTSLKHNYNGSNTVYGGAVNVNYGGVLAMNMAASIEGNINEEGGGVYVDGAMIVSDSIVVYNNYASTAKTKQNNVYLAPASSDKNRAGEAEFRVVQIGTSAADAYAQLLQPAVANYNTKVGVSKDDWDNTYEGYMPVVYAEGGTLNYLDEPYNTQNLIVHDGNIYELERYVTDLHADSPRYLYWLGTWVTAQYWNPYFESNEAEGYTPYMTAAQLNDISTPEQLAWVISLANGENGVDKTDENYVFSTVNITNDINMEDNIWVPIGTEKEVFKGTFNGNGHVIKGLKSSLNRTNMGMFGATEGATINDMVVNTRFNASANNMGAVIGTMKGGTLSNVEAVGIVSNSYADGNTGGLVGVNEATTGTAGKIHSSFSANDITGGKNIGGLVAVNNGNLINAYSNATIEGGTNVGGLVAINGGRVENCYNVTETTYPFAATNDGTITMCYAAEVELEEGEEMVYVGGGTGSLTGHGTYGAVLDRKQLGYLYNDNQVTLVNGQANANVAPALSYTGGKIEKWPGLLSTLNQWVSKNAGYTSWLRPTTADINGDLPVLCFPKDNCLATTNGRGLQYSAYNAEDISRANGLDNLLSEYKNKEANLFLYGNAIDVVNVPTEDVHVFINEDAVLLQKQQAGGTKANEANFINTTVGISFDNSDHGQNATDYFGNVLAYDWHLMSTPLADAKLGISYATDAETGYGKPADWSKVENSYMPDMTNGSDEEEGGDTGEGGKEGEDPEAEEDNTVKWDFYTYFEPQYHWINFKRSAGNHWHYDEPHDNIDYTGNEQTKGNLTAGRGYMMAISQDSYLNQTGTLNNGDVKIELTLSGDQTSDTEPTKDWGSNLIGNPYQAYLDLDVVSDETGLESFYVYDADNGTYGPYMTGASVNPAIPSQYIHPHQGFFAVINDAYVNAHSANAGDGGGKDAYTPKTVNVTLSYNMATAEKLPTSYFRGERIDYPVVNIFATNEKGSRDLAIIELGRPELNGVRKIENLRNANFKLYAHYDGGNYGLLFTPIDAKRVPVHFRTMEDGQFTLTWSTYNGTFTNLTLVDNLTGVRTNMLATDHYTFNGSVDDYAARFYITFNVTGVDEIDGGSDDFAWFDGNDWIVTGQGQLEVIDVTGRVLQSRRVSGEQTRLHLDNVAAGMYMMRLTDGNRAKVQKIVVK